MSETVKASTDSLCCHLQGSAEFAHLAMGIEFDYLNEIKIKSTIECSLKQLDLFLQSRLGLRIRFCKTNYKQSEDEPSHRLGVYD